MTGPRPRLLATMLLSAVLSAGAARAQTGMDPARSLMDNVSSTKELSTLASAIHGAGLVELLSGKGPFTLFAPTNAAFSALPAGALDRLLKPENSAALTRMVRYHLVAGRYDFAALKTLIAQGHGTGMLKTVAGDPLWFILSGNTLMVKDARGGMARVTTADLRQSNGVMHVVDKVMTP